MSTYHYNAGERDAAARIQGFVSVRNGIEYLLMGFAVNSSELKPAHRRFLRDLIARFHLNIVNPSARVDLIEGYTDSVSSERQREDRGLRSSRANEVVQALLGLGARREHIGRVEAAPADHYLTANDTQEQRVVNRAVLLRLSPISGRPLPPLPHPNPVPTPVRDRPQTLFRYKIRMTFGMSAFIADGLALDILDMTTGQLAIYDYRGVSRSFAWPPVQFSFRGRWNRFTRNTHVPVSGFGGPAVIGGAGHTDDPQSRTGLLLPAAPGGPLWIFPFDTGLQSGTSFSVGGGNMSLLFPPIPARQAPWPHDVDPQELTN